MKDDILKSFAQKAKRRLVGKETTVNAKIKVISADDDEFRSRVEQLLSQDDVVTNPVQYLMDDKILKNMDEEERERYLLSTLDKYTRFKNQIEHSQSYSAFCL
ncbi:MAG: hypothetical protein J6K39_03440 [Clostridia bacterium]|nr:hypothetical protein [Clostridia bacterium]